MSSQMRGILVVDSPDHKLRGKLTNSISVASIVFCSVPTVNDCNGIDHPVAVQLVKNIEVHTVIKLCQSTFDDFVDLLSCSVMQAINCIFESFGCPSWHAHHS
jgi:hypothetical protein